MTVAHSPGRAHVSGARRGFGRPAPDPSSISQQPR